MKIKWSAVILIILILVLNKSNLYAEQSSSCTSSGIRWASSSNTLYLTGSIVCTLSDIKSLTSAQVPLEQVDPINRIWYLGANLKLEGGATLILYGSSIGGDVNQLRLKSNNSDEANRTIWIRAQWGTLDIQNTEITSWNTATNSPDTEYSSYKRSYIHVRSYLDVNGITPRESRMDIKNSEIKYLGYNGSEAYGLVWKVSGSAPNLYNKVNVYGNVIGSRIHHNYFGAYTYGAYGMNWQNNEIDHNVKYGLDPHDDSDYLTIENNYSHDNGNHGIICSQRCDHLTIRNNISNNNIGNGIMLHRNTNFSLVENNTASANTDAGLAIFDSHNNIIRNNIFDKNKYGIRFSVGSSYNVVEKNKISGSKSYGLYFYKGSDAPTSGDGHPKFNQFSTNKISTSGSYIIKIRDSDDNTFTSNDFSGTSIYLDRGLRNKFDNNTLGNNIYYQIKGSSSISSSFYLSGQDFYYVKVDQYSNVTIKDFEGKIIDPEEPDIATVVNISGSIIILNYANIGSSSQIFTRNMKVKVNNGELYVNPADWQVSGNYQKIWTARSNSAIQNISYIIGDLVPGKTFRLYKNGVLYQNLISNSSGEASFMDNIESDSLINYVLSL